MRFDRHRLDLFPEYFFRLSTSFEIRGFVLTVSHHGKRCCRRAEGGLTEKLLSDLGRAYEDRSCSDLSNERDARRTMSTRLAAGVTRVVKYNRYCYRNYYQIHQRGIKNRRKSAIAAVLWASARDPSGSTFAIYMSIRSPSPVRARTASRVRKSRAKFIHG